uniref:Uncharacterized protein n=1 Tax=Gossypium raimondii TaxID=29730 RepID=A0A0D2NGA7_GOSRA|nr:hypothetical protein B456_002G006600 [Gossypium raimondii]
MEATKIPPPQQMEDKEEKESPEDEEGPKSGGGWGGWVFSTFSVLSDLQKAAAVAAEEIALNASGVAENAAKTIADIQAAKTIGRFPNISFADCISSLNMIFRHEIRFLWRGAAKVHHGGLPAGSVAPSLIKTRKPFTTKGMQVLDRLRHNHDMLYGSCIEQLYHCRESATVDSHEALPQASIQEKAKSFSEHLHDDRATAVSKI